jgi:hypothetical protein
MKLKIKPVLTAVSFSLNGVFILLFILASLSKTSFFSFSDPGKEYTSAAAVISFPSKETAAFGEIEISLKRGEKAFLQFSVFSNKRQADLLINSLYDHEIISVSPYGRGIIIEARNKGGTLMQTFTNEGIKDLAFIAVSE